MKKGNEIAANVKWFKQFNLLERLKLSISQQKAIKILRGLKIEGIRRPA